MAKGTITFLFDSGQVFQEAWDFSDDHRDLSLARLRRIAQARLSLLASCVRIVLLKVKGSPLERVAWRGTAGAYAHPRYALKLIDDGRMTRIFLRGVPKEVYAADALTCGGIEGFRLFNRVLNECSCVFPWSDEKCRIAKLEPYRQTLFSYRKDKKATLRKLTSILGVEAAEQFWDELKKKRDAQTRTTPVVGVR